MWHPFEHVRAAGGFIRKLHERELQLLDDNCIILCINKLDIGHHNYRRREERCGSIEPFGAKTTRGINPLSIEAEVCVKDYSL